MKRIMQRGRKGFTLIELLVVIAIIGILAALLFPAVQAAMTKAKAVKTGSDGRQIHMGLYAENVKRVEMSTGEVWPSDTYGGTSTDFFRMCIESNVLENFSIRDFGAPGLIAPTGTNYTDLTEANNAWCITIGCGESTPADAPLIFTRNFKGGTTLDSIDGMDETVKPFGNKVGVVVTFGGSVKVLAGKDMRDSAQAKRLFNPSGSQLKFVKP